MLLGKAHGAFGYTWYIGYNFKTIKWREYQLIVAEIEMGAKGCMEPWKPWLKISVAVLL